jgi:hypothetical protein
VNFTFRIEKIAGNHRIPLLFSEPAMQHLGIECRCVVEEQVTGFNGTHKLFAPKPFQEGTVTRP